MPQVVQFLHPGSEHRPDTDNPSHKSWNPPGADHRRKFLLSPGVYLDAGGRSVSAELEFWGEWEPPSTVESLLVPQVGYPKYRQRPYLPELINGNLDGQNTDPLVFGQSFIYANCQQPHSPTLRNLEIGSLILFGSMKGQRCAERFLLDTVFVVGSTTKYHPLPPDLDGCLASRPFQKRVSIEARCEEDDLSRDLLTCYFGATPEQPSGEIYGFVPSRVFDKQTAGFPRVPLVASRFVNPKKTQGIKVTPNVSATDIRKFWNELRAQVTSLGLVEGVSFAEPGRLLVQK